MKQNARKPAAEALRALAGGFWDAKMRMAPLRATLGRYPRYHDRLDDVSPSGRARNLTALKALRSRLGAVDAAALSADDRITWEVLDFQLDLDIEIDRHKFWQWSVDHIDGHHSLIASVVELAQPMKTAADAEALLERIDAMPRYFRDHIRNLREGVSEGRVASRRSVEKTVAALESALNEPVDRTPFAAAVGRLPSGIRPRWRSRVLKAVQNSAFGAYRSYRDFLTGECLAPARPDDRPGILHMPGGIEAYRYRIRRETTVEASAGEIHRIGIEELAGIHREMKTAARRMGLSSDLGRAFEQVRSEPANFFKTRGEIIRTICGLIGRIQADLPSYFGKLPKTEVRVESVPSFKERTAPAGQYYTPPDDLSRPGIFYVNTWQPKSRPRFSVASLTAHETVPGHHLQLALAAENRSLPLFRRRLSFTAYVEGWALYSERLADEMGLYADDLTRFGMLTDQAFRACRLVVDTGLHALGWSRGKAVDFLKVNTPMSEPEIVSEVDRYIAWPGQALAYMTGKREISALRREFLKKRGEDALPRFHDSVLGQGALPLPILRRVVLSAA